MRPSLEETQAHHNLAPHPITPVFSKRRPRLTLSGKRKRSWVCGGGGQWGWGATPRAAYNAWLWNMLNCAKTEVLLEFGIQL